MVLQGGFAFLRKSHGGYGMPPACRQEPPFESLLLLEHQESPPPMAVVFLGAPGGIRTPDTLLKRQVLCRLSYWGKWGG